MTLPEQQRQAPQPRSYCIVVDGDRRPRNTTTRPNVSLGFGSFETSGFHSPGELCSSKGR